MTSTSDVAGLCAELRDRSDHYLADWAADVMSRAAALLEQQANALRAMEATLARVARVDNSLAKQLSESIATNAGLASDRDTLRARLKEAEKVIKPFASTTLTWDGAAIGLERNYFAAARAFNQGGK